MYTEEQQEAILKNTPDSAFIFIGVVAKSDGTIDSEYADLFGNNFGAICTAVTRLKEIYTCMEDESDSAVSYILTHPKEDNDDKLNEDNYEGL